MTTALLFALLSTFATSSVQDPETLALTLKDGGKVEAKVLGVEGDSVRLQVVEAGGKMQIVRDLDEFAPASVFTIEMVTQRPTDFEGHFRMAKRAAELGLVEQVGAAARSAIEAAKGDEQRRDEVRVWAADMLQSRLRSAVEQGELDDAQQYLKLLSTRFSDQLSEEQIEALQEQVAGLKRDVRTRLRAERQQKADEKAWAEIAPRLQPIEKRIEQGDRVLQEAIRNSRHTAQSAGLCEKAIAAYDSAQKELQDIEAEMPDAPQLAAEVDWLADDARRSSVRAALHAANLLTVQSDYKGAMEWVARVLEKDPENAEAKEMAQTIQVSAAAASGVWGWGWGWSGLGRSAGGDARNR